MDVLKESELSAQQASRMMSEFAEDAFLEEQDPDLSALIKRVSANLAITAFEIRAAPEGQKDAPETDVVVPAAAPTRRRRTKKHADE
jgi:Na+-transporting methylmalonyl-CoA/oxaloacetate decarboxylase gamma subunit